MPYTIACIMRVISAEELSRLLSPVSLVEALRDIFKHGAEAPLRHHHSISLNHAEATLLIMPAWNRESSPGRSTARYAGVKMVNVYPSNASLNLPTTQGAYVLFDKNTGAPLAVIDGSALTLYRTAAASVLAATYLARVDSRRLLMVGTGALAPYVVRAYVNNFSIDEVQIWGRSAEKAQSLADALQKEQIPARPARSLQDAVPWADIVSCATSSTVPLVLGNWLRQGHHIDLIGGFTPEMRESDDACIKRATVFVDTREGVLAEAGDLIQPIQKGVISERSIAADLFALTRSAHHGRTSDREITLFKSVGTALEDLAAAQLAFEAGSA